MTRRIYMFIAIAWCLMAVPAAWADETVLGAGGQDSGDKHSTAESVSSQAAAAVTTAQNAAADEERLKLFGFMPRRTPQPASPPDSAGDKTPAVQPAPASGDDVQPAAADQAAPVPDASTHGLGQSAPAAASEAQPPAETTTAGTDQPATAAGQAGGEGVTTEAPESSIQNQTQEQSESPPAAMPHKAVQWSYNGTGAAQFWGDLKPEFATCGNGKHQSPIDISTATITALPKIQFDYHDTPLRVVNNGHSIQVNYQRGSFIVVDGKRYDLLQVHFHTPSEHTMGGKAYPMAAHLVHKSADGELLVIAVLMQTGESNPVIDRIWQQLPSAAGQIKVADEQSINVADLLPKDGTYFTYTGSLTTPPCTEGVKWVVLSAPVTVSQAQLDKFTALFAHNARPVEPLNGRTVLFSN